MLQRVNLNTAKLLANEICTTHGYAQDFESRAWTLVPVNDYLVEKFRYAPYLDEVCKWLRDEHKIIIAVDYYLEDNCYMSFIYYDGIEYNEVYESGFTDIDMIDSSNEEFTCYDTYEEAQEAAIDWILTYLV